MQTSSLSLTLEQRILALYEAGMTNAVQIHRKISRVMRVSITTIERKVNRLKRGLSFEVTERKQRADKFLTEEVAREIEEYMQQNPSASASQIIIDLNYDVTTRTMRRAMKELGFQYSSTLKVPLMTMGHIEDRLAFAEKNLRKTWANAVFVDECSFLTHTFPKKAYQKRGRRLTYSCPKKPGKVHIWGGISLNGKTTLHIFTENLTGKLYRTILRTKLLPSMQRLYGGTPWILVQDNDPKHTCNVVSKFIRENNIQLQKNWPANSPDMNPIENIWAIMKSEISKIRPQTTAELNVEIRTTWRLLSDNTIVNCIQSMSNRLQLVLDNNGNKIPY